MDHDVIVYIEEQCSEGSLSSSLVIPTLYLIAHWRALLVVRLFVLERRVVATTLVTMMILETFSLLYAWLIPHLMAKSSASVLVTKAAWWTVLIKGWLHMWTCNTNIVMSFLTLASVVTIAVCGEEDECNIISFSCWKRVLLFFSLLTKLKEN